MNREELFIETDAVKRNITRMMFTDDIEELCELLCVTNITISRVFKENLKRINEQEELKNRILEESLEIEEDYDVDVSDCIRNCSTCKNNVEFPSPHTCDICTSLDQDEDYEMWELKDDIHWYSEMLKKPEQHKRVIVRDENGNEYRNHVWTGHAWHIFDNDYADCPTNVDIISWRYQ